MPRQQQKQQTRLLLWRLDCSQKVGAWAEVRGCGIASTRRRRRWGFPRIAWRFLCAECGLSRRSGWLEQPRLLVAAPAPARTTRHDMTRRVQVRDGANQDNDAQLLGNVWNTRYTKYTGSQLVPWNIYGIPWGSHPSGYLVGRSMGKLFTG